MTEPINPPAPPASPPAPPAPPTPPSPPASPPATPGEQQDTFSRDYVEKLRNENASHRTKVNSLTTELDSFKQGIAKALGIGDQGEPDPAKLQSELQTVQSNYRQERLQRLVLSDSLKQGADPQLTFPYLLANDILKDIDVSSPDAAQQISDAVTAAIEAYPKLKADFGVSPPPPPTVNVGGGSNPPGGGAEPPLPDKNPWAEETFNLTEQWAIMQADKDLADRLRRAAQA